MPPQYPLKDQANAEHILRCIGCAASVDPSHAPADFRCAGCGQLYDVEYPQKLASTIRQPWLQRRQSFALLDESGVWRFREALPVLRDLKNVVTLREGNTPLYPMPRCATFAGVNQLWAKHQGANPTASFKDAGMTVALSVARENGYAWVACASTGNTSASMAAYAARAGMRSLVLIPDGKVAWGKLAQALDYGALTLQLGTDFDGCVKVLAQVVERAHVALLNSVNPYRLEGQKTPAFEIAEAWDWQPPDHLLVPGGNLANSSALGMGFRQLKDAGFISRLPRISIIQAQGANSLYTSWQTAAGEVLHPVKADTRASAIRIGSPASWKKAVRELRFSDGFCEQVTEAEIAIAKAEIGAEGIGCEPASSVTLAGLRKLVRDGRIGAHESVVLLLTGHTLKDPEYTLDFHRAKLLSAKEYAALPAESREQMRRIARPPQALDATADAVLRALDAAETGNR